MSNHDSDLKIYNEIESYQKEFEDKFSRHCKYSCYNHAFQFEGTDEFLFEYDENYKQVFENKHLSKKTKTLIALAVACAVNCPYCINLFYKDAIDFGWSNKDVREAIEVAAAVCSGFSSIHAVQKMNEAKEMLL